MEVLIESENAIGNQDDSEQAVPQKDTNVKDTNVCGDMLPKVFDKLKSVKMEGFLVKFLTLTCSDFFLWKVFVSSFFRVRTLAI